MDRKVYLTVLVKLIIRVDEGRNISDVMDNIQVSLPDYQWADLLDFELGEAEVTDSK